MNKTLFYGIFIYLLFNILKEIFIEAEQNLIERKINNRNITVLFSLITIIAKFTNIKKIWIIFFKRKLIIFLKLLIIYLNSIIIRKVKLLNNIKS